MKERILGIDAGTNSLGWAIVEYNEDLKADKYKLIDRGVNVFQDGVKNEKGMEKSRAAERTEFRRQRIGYWRRKCRKIRLLTFLAKYNLCPALTKESLRAWRSGKKYPENDEFRFWQLTDDKENKNPYYYRNLCVSQKLDLSVERNRFIVGRAIYHINQRRGFLSNRKEGSNNANGVVLDGITEITEQMQAAGCRYLGQYFYELYKTGQKIRCRYTHRIEHYEAELLAICRMQGFDAQFTDELRKIIINQRPLKSQKHTVGKCVFEPKKNRCPQSHPLFEQFRMYQFISNIEVQGPGDTCMRHLDAAERRSIIPLFLRVSKKEFEFREIAVKLSNSKNNYCFYKDRDSAFRGYRFNYHMDTIVCGCPVIAQLADVFAEKGSEDAWLDQAVELYTLGVGKNKYQILNDIWHVLFNFEDEDHLKCFAVEKLQLREAEAQKFAKIKLPQGYASLSLNAIAKILPYMKKYGLIFSHAVFLANAAKVVGAPIDDEAMVPVLPMDKALDVVKAFDDYKEARFNLPLEITEEKYVKMRLLILYNMPETDMVKLNCLYHPSMIEQFPKVLRPNPDGVFQLGSPRTSSLRNPMAMRSLFRIRHVINTLLAKGKIDKSDTIRIEFARELNDSNKRAAIRSYQKKREVRFLDYAKEIKKLMGADYEPTDVDLLKYDLWVEQNHICLYTGKTIALSDLFDANVFDIEHTIPRSVGGDSTQENLTLCDARFNRETKRNMMPSQLANHDDIMERIAVWKERYENIEADLRKISTHGIAEKELKDAIIRKRHLLVMERDYWKGKYTRFVMTEVKEGFARRQGVDIGIISRYARLYLKSLFRNVHIVNGVVTSEFRKIWGIQEEYERKSRSNHCHHAIDAITIACIGLAEYGMLAQYYHDEERYRWGIDSKRAVFPKPWSTFTQDVKSIADEMIVRHYTPDNMPKHTKKRIRGTVGKYMQGDTARGLLHEGTLYGAIEQDGQLRYVVRKALDSDKFKPENIVDEVVKQKVLDAINEHGSLKDAVAAGIWMNKEKGIRILKARVYQNTVKKPMSIGQHRDKSVKEYKRNIYVANDSIYLAAVYEGLDAKGKVKRDFLFYNNMEAARHFALSQGERSMSVVPPTNGNGLTLKYVLKTGTMLLLYQDDEQEVLKASKYELQRCLYKVTVFDVTMKRIVITHQQEARQSKDVPVKGGAYKQNEEFRPKIKITLNALKALVEGQDFVIDEDGEIKFRKA